MIFYFTQKRYLFNDIKRALNIYPIQLFVYYFMKNVYNMFCEQNNMNVCIYYIMQARRMKKIEMKK